MDSPARDGRKNSLNYMAEMLAQLREIAKAEGYESLVYLIGMAESEAAELLHAGGSGSRQAKA
jgi:hypothetical protein